MGFAPTIHRRSGLGCGSKHQPTYVRKSEDGELRISSLLRRMRINSLSLAAAAASASRQWRSVEYINGSRPSWWRHKT
jgi:hypothetical protein